MFKRKIYSKMQEWKKEAEKKGVYNPESTKDIETKTSY